MIYSFIVTGIVIPIRIQHGEPDAVRGGIDLEILVTQGAQTERPVKSVAIGLIADNSVANVIPIDYQRCFPDVVSVLEAGDGAVDYAAAG